MRISISMISKMPSNGMPTLPSTTSSGQPSGKRNVTYIPPTSTNLFNKSSSVTTAKSDKDAEINTRNVFAAAIFGAITFVHSYLLFRK